MRSARSTLLVRRGGIDRAYQVRGFLIWMMWSGPFVLDRRGGPRLAVGRYTKRAGFGPHVASTADADAGASRGARPRPRPRPRSRVGGPGLVWSFNSFAIRVATARDLVALSLFARAIRSVMENSVQCSNIATATPLLKPAPKYLQICFSNSLRNNKSYILIELMRSM